MILITEFMDEAAVARLRETYAVDYAPDLVEDPSQIPVRLQGCQALIVRNRTRVTDALLAAAPDLKCVGRLGVGLDNIDQTACATRDVTVYPASGANNLSVAEYVIASAMMLLRGAYDRKAQMLAGDWPRQQASGREISGKVLGLVGYGAIARDTGALGRAIGLEILAYDPFLPADHAAWGGAKCCTFDDLIAQADVLSLHVPLTDETRHMINANTFHAMKPGAVLINAARGGVVDETALCAALNSGELAGAALDVFETEPLTSEAASKFDRLDNVILTPHIGGVTEESNTRVSAMIADLVLKHLSSA